MGNNDFALDIIARLNKRLSEAQLKSDLNGLDNTLSVKVIAKLATALSKKQLSDSLKQLNNLYIQVGTRCKTDKNTRSILLNEIEQLQKNLTELQLKVNVEKGASQNAINSVISMAKTAQRYADKTSIALDIEVHKEKAVNDIVYIGQKYSKLFSDIAASRKYENLLNSTYSITDKSQLQEVRTQISAFNSELKASGLAAESTDQKWKKLIDRAKELFSAASIVRAILVQAKQAVSNIVELDTVYTDLIKVNDQLNRNDYADYLSRCNQKAQELATTQKALMEGATEFSKSGYDLSTSDALAEKSTILSNVGDMESSESAKAIISGVQAYDVVDGYTDVVNKAQALIDKYTELGNTASITTAELARGVQSVGSVFADANTSVDEFLALLSSGNRQYQDADALASALKTSALRIRGASAELEEAGEDTEGVMSTLDNQKAIKALTGVDIFEKDQKTIRSMYDIFLDISKVYKDMSDVDQSALLDIIAGKHRASAISATLNNMTEAQEILQSSLNAAGSAQRAYDTYLKGTQAHLQQFQSKLVETYSTFVNGDMISHAADLGTAVLDLVNKTDLLKHSLIAVTALKIGQGISAVGGAIAGTITQMNTLGNAIQQIKSLPLDDDLRKTALKEIGIQTQNLTEKNLKLLLSQKQLVDNDRVVILGKHDLNKEQALAKLETMGLTTATNANTTANTTNAGSVFTLKGAFTGLTASVKAAWAAMSALQKASIILAAVSAAWSIGSSIVNGIKQDNEELRQATEEAANAYKDSASSIEDYASKYQELHKALLAAKGDEEETYNIKKQLMTLQKELNDKYGEEYGAVNLVTDAYKDQTDVIKALNKEAAQKFLNENREGIEKAEKEMTKERHYNLSDSDISAFTEEGAALKEVAEKYKDAGITLSDELGDGSYLQFSVHLNADAQSAYETINAFETDLRNKAKELGDEHMFDDVLDVSSGSLNKARETLDEYEGIYKQALIAQIASDDNRAEVYNSALKAVQKYNEAVMKSEDPYNDENVASARENLETIKNSVQSNEEEWGKYSSVMDDIFDQADTRLTDFNNVMQDNSELRKLAEDLNGMTAGDIQSLNAGENESFDKLKEAAAGYKVSVDELMDALIRLGYVQGEVQGTPSNFETPIPPLSVSDTISQLTTQLKPAFDALKSAYQSIFTDDGFTLENVDLSMLDSIKSSIDDLNSMEGAEIDIDYASFENLAKVLTDTASTEDDVHKAMDLFATDIVSALNPALSQCSGEAYLMMQSLLESLGVMNSEQVMASAKEIACKLCVHYHRSRGRLINNTSQKRNPSVHDKRRKEQTVNNDLSFSNAGREPESFHFALCCGYGIFRLSCLC
ncbi:phage tail tape measure protein [Lachnospiraceae bacterium JLR.KK008]